jgi:transcriptional regulator with GAF, ATPase, and Fis domain
MKLPSNISNSFIQNQCVPKVLFDQATELFFEEEFLQSKTVLDEALEGNVYLIQNDDVSGDDLISLYAKNLLFLRESTLLEKFFEKLEISDFFQYPKLLYVKLDSMTRDGKAEEVIQTCTSFINSHRDPISLDVAGFLARRGHCKSRTGDVESALIDLETAHSFFEFQNNDYEKGLVADRYGILQMQLSNYWESKKWLKRGLQVFEKFGRKQQVCRTLLNLGVTHYKSGDLTAATTVLKKSHAIGEAGNWPHRMVFTNIALANVLRMQRDYTESRQRLHTAYTQAQDLGYPREEALALEFLGDVYRDEGQYGQAKRFYARALAIGLVIAPKGDIVMEIHRRNGECLLAQGEFGEAVDELKKSIRMAQAQGDRFEEGVALRVMSEIKKEAGDLNAAEDFISQSVEILERIGARFELTLSLASWSELKIRQVDRASSHIPASLLLSQAWNHATKALDHSIFTKVIPLIEDCRHKVQRLSKMRAGQDLIERTHSIAGVKGSAIQSRGVIVHQSSVMRDLLEMTDIFAGTDDPVLITGETGTGKELIARRLHQNSEQAAGKLVSVNVTTIAGTMFEREMFGHVRGSFSGADRDGIGFVGEADGGTLFLDEIGELPLDMQPKLLRLLQEGTYQAIGDPTERRAQIRIVAATNASLEEKVQQGTFRADLFYRLKVMVLELPPLRERYGDVPLLLRHFLSEAAGRQVEVSNYFDLDSLDLLERHTWPGNIRELGVLARRAHIELRSRGRVQVAVQKEGGEAFWAKGPKEIPAEKKPDLEMEASSGNDSSLTYNSANERARIVMAMDQSGGNRAEAAEALGMARSTLYRRMKKLGL